MKKQALTPAGFRILPAEKQALREIAAARGDSLSQYLRSITRNHIFINKQNTQKP